MHIAFAPICRRYLSHVLGFSLVLGTPLVTHAQTPPTPSTLSGSTQLLASRSRAYDPPPGSRGAGGANTGGGVRGCGNEMLALAPRFSGVGQSFATRPTFVWYMNSMPAGRLTFELYHQDEEGDRLLWQADILQSETGTPDTDYIAYTLPATAPALTIGETYRWQAVVYCAAMPDVMGRWVGAPVTIVEPPRGLGLLDEIAPTASQKAIRFAQSGYWYEALAAVYAGDTADEVALRDDLLLDLADLAADTEGGTALRWSDRLRAIVEDPME